jgi:hypothetical protein
MGRVRQARPRPNRPPSPRPAQPPPHPGRSPAPASPYSSSRGAAPQRHVQALPTPTPPPPPGAPTAPGAPQPHTQTTGPVTSPSRAGSSTSPLRDRPAQRLSLPLAKLHRRARTRKWARAQGGRRAGAEEGGASARPLARGRYWSSSLTVCSAEVPAGGSSRDRAPACAFASFAGGVTARGSRP